MMNNNTEKNLRLNQTIKIKEGKLGELLEDVRETLFSELNLKNKEEVVLEIEKQYFCKINQCGKESYILVQTNSSGLEDTEFISFVAPYCEDCTVSYWSSTGPYIQYIVSNGKFKQKSPYSFWE